MKRALGLLLAVSPGLVCACRSTRAAVDAAPADVLQRAISADNRGDLDGVMSCYASGAVLVPPRGARVEGLDAIRRRYAEAIDQYRFDLACRTNELDIEERLAWVRGETSGRLTSRTDGSTVLVHDAFLATLRQEDAGTWRITRLAWSPTPQSSAPPPASTD